MVTGDIVPNGDATPNDWFGEPDDADHYKNIDEDKGAPNAERINALTGLGDDNELENFDFTTLDDIQDNSITQVVVWTYGIITGTNSPEVAISWDGGANWSAYVSTGIRVVAWYSNTFAGLSYSKADLDQFQISYRANVPDKLNTHNIYTCYVVVTYTEAVSGWAHKFNGVAGASIGKISGVAIANIGKVKGV